VFDKSQALIFEIAPLGHKIKAAPLVQHQALFLVLKPERSIGHDRTKKSPAGKYL